MAERLYVRQSEIKGWKRCRRNTRWQYWMGLQRSLVTSTTTADTGTIAHAGLAALYRGQDPFVAMAAWLAAKPEALRPLFQPNYELAVIMIEGYLQWLAEEGEDAGMTVTGVERTVEVPFLMVDGYEVWLTGQVDLEVIDRHGNPGLIDHKSVDRLDLAPMDLLDEQRMTYSIMRDIEDGTKYRWTAHNQLRRVKRGAQAKPPFFARPVVTFNETQLLNHRKHMEGTVAEIVRHRLAIEAGADHQLLLPPNPTKDCSWDCRFREACKLSDDGSDVEGFLAEWYIESVPVRGRTQEEN